jgi:hypothetical protein
MIQENRDGYERLGGQVRDLLLTISDVVEPEMDREGTLAARTPHVENLKRCVCNSFEKTSLPLIRRNT